ncbi:hypothetical protein ACC724_39605, partial [Rhizobium ruizarguesonis]
GRLKIVPVAAGKPEEKSLELWLVPAGLVINELLTNTLKHALVGRDGGEITLRCVVSDTG